MNIPLIPGIQAWQAYRESDMDVTERERTEAVLEKNMIEEIIKTRDITPGQLEELLKTEDTGLLEELREAACETAKQIYGTGIYLRGLIEFTNYCKNDCYYCGIRKSNRNAVRYRLTKEEILACCKAGHELGFGTFVLQGGEDPYFTDERICDIVSEIRICYPDCAITLSLGEKTKESYQRYFNAGADRYLLRHETADTAHYAKLHPPELSLEHRMKCLRELKEIGYQTGCGFMVGSPYQTVGTIYRDIQFIRELKPHMVGIGPFIPHGDTPFADREQGSLERTLRLLSLIRLIDPYVLLPATTALGTIHPQGRERGILAGANVVMPNLSPVSVREKYMLYNNKICTGEEAAECRDCLRRRIEGIGYRIETGRGDKKFSNSKDTKNMF